MPTRDAPRSFIRTQTFYKQQIVIFNHDNRHADCGIAVMNPFALITIEPILGSIHYCPKGITAKRTKFEFHNHLPSPFFSLHLDAVANSVLQNLDFMLKCNKINRVLNFKH
jgi:hypothetical protein